MSKYPHAAAGLRAQLILQKAIFNSYWLLSGMSKAGIRDNDTCWNSREAKEKAISLPWLCKSMLGRNFHIQKDMMFNGDTIDHLNISASFFFPLELIQNNYFKFKYSTEIHCEVSSCLCFLFSVSLCPFDFSPCHLGEHGFTAIVS